MSGGGVALGPKPRSYAQRTPKKMVRLALLSALSDRAEIGRVAVIDEWTIAAPKTKDAVTILRKLRLTGTVLIVLAHDELDVERSFANLPRPRRRLSPSSRRTTCCGPTGCSSPTARCRRPCRSSRGLT